MEDFRVALAKRALICDGAIGTTLYERGAGVSSCFEALNIERPELIGALHRDYVRAGVDVIQTNSFGANALKLRAYALEDRADEINRAAVALARERAGSSVYVAASIGPLGAPMGIALDSVGRSEARKIFARQAEALYQERPDLFILETFYSLDEIEIAIEAARSVSASVPIVAQMTFPESGYDESMSRPALAARRLAELGVDALGANCSVGPNRMLEIVRAMVAATSMPVTAQPNAGAPQARAGRMIYLTTPDYFRVYAKRFFQAGARMVGGCCGVSPSHIEALRGMTSAFSSAPRVEIANIAPDDAAEFPSQGARAQTPRAIKSGLAGRIAAGEWVNSVELLPPKGADASKTVASARLLRAGGVGFVNIPDGPRAMARMNPIATALKIVEAVDIEPIVHYTCRDKNLLGMQSDILGADSLGLKNILVVTGDPPNLGNYPMATGVYDIDSIGLVKMIRNLNRARDIIGAPINGGASIHIGVGVNPGALNLDEEMRRFELKVEAGAEYCMTQPVYDKKTIERFLRRAQGFKIPTLLGILPITSYAMVEFLNNEIPGMETPEHVRDRIFKAGDRAAQVGMEIARESLDECRSLVAGAYVMIPSGRVELALGALGLDSSAGS